MESPQSKVTYFWRVFFKTSKEKSAQVLLGRFLKAIDVADEADCQLEVYYKTKNYMACVKHDKLGHSAVQDFFDAIVTLGEVSYRHNMNSPSVFEGGNAWECDCTSDNIRGHWWGRDAFPSFIGKGHSQLIVEF